MRNPYEFPNEYEAGGEPPCDQCGDGAVVDIEMQGHARPVKLCGKCADDQITTCPGCEQTIWCKDGTRVYTSASLYCASCCAQHPVIATILDRALHLDEARDAFHQVRR